MRTYVLKRLLLMIPTTIGITMIVFLIAYAAPGDPFERRSLDQQGLAQQGKLARERKEILQKFYHLDRDPVTGYFLWLRDFFDTEKNISIDTREFTLTRIARALPITVFLNVVSLVIIYLLAIPIGVDAAVHAGTSRVRATTATLFVLYALPTFWVASLLKLYMGSPQHLHWFPVHGIAPDNADDLSLVAFIAAAIPFMVLPLVCYTYGGLAGLSRYMRAGMLDVIRQDYVRTARAKGLPESVVLWRHAFRNALIPMVTLAAGLLPGLLGGSVIIENIFGLPGMGKHGFDSATSKDFPMVNTIALIGAILVQLGILLSDLAYAWVDPRITFEGGEEATG